MILFQLHEALDEPLPYTVEREVGVCAYAWSRVECVCIVDTAQDRRALIQLLIVERLAFIYHLLIQRM